MDNSNSPEYFLLKAVSYDNPERNETEPFWTGSYENDLHRYFEAGVFVEKKLNIEGFDIVQYEPVEVCHCYDDYKEVTDVSSFQ